MSRLSRSATVLSKMEASGLEISSVRFPAAPPGKAGQSQKPWPAFFFVNVSSAALLAPLKIGSIAFHAVCP